MRHCSPAAWCSTAATVPLQRLGFDVWALPTVVYSSHAGYPGVRGRRTPISTLRELLAGLQALGRLDRCALPRPAPAAAVIPAGRVPRSEVERALASIWEGLLAVKVSVDDDFFALGGHSLLAARVAARIRAGLGVEVPLRRLFELRTLDSLARHVDTLRWATTPDGPAQDGAALDGAALDGTALDGTALDGTAVEEGAL